MLDLRYTTGRLLALGSIVPANLDEDQSRLVAKLLEEQNEPALFELLEGMGLSSKARRKLELVKQAREVALKLQEYWKAIPLPHKEIEESYKVIRDLRDEFELLGEGAPFDIR